MMIDFKYPLNVFLVANLKRLTFNSWVSTPLQVMSNLRPRLFLSTHVHLCKPCGHFSFFSAILWYTLFCLSEISGTGEQVENCTSDNSNNTNIKTPAAIWSFIFIFWNPILSLSRLVLCTHRVKLWKLLTLTFLDILYLYSFTMSEHNVSILIKEKTSNGWIVLFLIELASG